MLLNSFRFRFILQYRALRLVFNDFASSYESLLDKVNMPTLHISRIRLIANETFKILHNMSPVRFGSATRTQNFEREVFFYYFSNFPLFLFVKLPDFRSRSLGPAISHCWSLFSPKLRV